MPAPWKIVEDTDPPVIANAAGTVSFIAGSGGPADAAYQAFLAGGGVPDPVAPPASPRVISSYEFMTRFTPEERASIRVAAAADPTSDLADLYDLQRAAQVIELDDATVIAGLAALEGAGLIGEGRAAEIRA